ncbi:MAG: hypothetical protein KJ709_06685 [Nanoarchaeota archaeon]|nr:hypothetical protein [Nanoarchaeota archaeon]
MKAFVTTHKGAEDICMKELGIKDLVFTCTPERLMEIAYTSQSITDAGIFIGWLDDIEEAERYLPAEFSVKGDMDLNGEIGERLLKLEPKSKVNLDNPEVRFIIFQHKKKGLGIRIADCDLAKRDYKIFHHPGSIKGTLAYCLIQLAGYRPGKVLIDPFCCSGEIPIEAALMSFHGPNFYRKDSFSFPGKDFDLIKYDRDSKEKLDLHGHHQLLAFIKSSQKNAKIAGIQKLVSFSRGDITWLDTKFKKGSVDCIVTHMPKFTKKLAEELVHQADFVLRLKARMTISSNDAVILKHASERYSLKIIDERTVWQGKAALTVVTFEKR